MISLGLLAPHRSSPRFLVGRGFDAFSKARDVAELLRNSAPVSDHRRLIVGVHAMGFVESRSDSTTRTAQCQRTSPELEPSDIRRRFSQRLRFMSSVMTQTTPSLISARVPTADTGRVVRLIISVSAPMEFGRLASHRASAHCSPRGVYSDRIPRAASPRQGRQRNYTSRGRK